MKNINVVLRSKKEHVLEDLRLQERKLNQAVEALNELDDFFPTGTVEGLMKISEEGLVSYVESLKKSIHADKRFTRKLRLDTCANWDKLVKEAKPYCAIVEASMKMPIAIHRNDDGSYSYDTAEAVRFAEKEATIKIDGVLTEYYQKLNVLAGMYNDIVGFERENNLLPLATNGAIVRNGSSQTLHFSLEDFLFNSTSKEFGLSQDAFGELLMSGALGRMRCVK